jgi:hypothetical protein
MRYKRAVEKLRLLAEGCEEIGSWPSRDEPYLVEMYAFGAVLEGPTRWMRCRWPG